MALVIRQGSEADIDQIAQVLVDTWRATFRGRLSDEFLDGMTYESQADRQRRIQRRGGVAYWVACTSDGAVAGFVSGGPIRQPVSDYDAELYALYVRAEFQGQGVGARVVTAFGHEMATRPFQRMLVWVLAMNANAGFYARMGARPFATQPIQLGPEAVDEVAYVWDDLSRRFG